MLCFCILKLRLVPFLCGTARVTLVKSGGHVAMARVAMTGTAAADPVADGAGAQAPATVVPPGMRSGRWNSSDRAQLEDAG